MKLSTLVARADDAGSCAAANHAIADCLKFGVLRNVSLMACGPAIEEAVELIALAQDKADFGLHVCLNSEWQLYRWGPVADLSLVPDLVRRDGTFTSHPKELSERGLAIEQALVEVEAQWRRLMDLGFPVRYMDEHMGVGWISGLGSALEGFAHEKGLVFRPSLTNLPSGENWGERLQKLEPGVPALFVSHPCLPDPLVRELMVHDGLEPGDVEKERVADWCFLTAPETTAGLARIHVATLRYSDLPVS